MVTFGSEKLPDGILTGVSAHFPPLSRRKVPAPFPGGEGEGVEGSAMKFSSHILGLAIACLAMPALAKPAYVASTVNLRAAPGTGSEIVAKIPGGSLVDAGGW